MQQFLSDIDDTKIKIILVITVKPKWFRFRGLKINIIFCCFLLFWVNLRQHLLMTSFTKISFFCWHNKIIKQSSENKIYCWHHFILMISCYYLVMGINFHKFITAIAKHNKNIQIFITDGMLLSYISWSIMLQRQYQQAHSSFCSCTFYKFTRFLSYFVNNITNSISLHMNTLQLFHIRNNTDIAHIQCAPEVCLFLYHVHHCYFLSRMCTKVMLHIFCSQQIYHILHVHSFLFTTVHLALALKMYPHIQFTTI